MTFDRFKQIWDALVTNRVYAPGPKRPPDTPASDRLVDELVKVSEGKPSAFDEIEARG